VGAGGVGKSALTTRFVSGVFVERYDPTIEDSFRKELDVEGHFYRLDILDTAGSEQFTSMRDIYIKSAHGVVIVYSITSQDSWNEACALHDRILLNRESDPEFPIVLVGNKCDLSKNRVVLFDTGRAKAESWRVSFLEASAKTAQNVEESFRLLTEKMILRYPLEELEKTANDLAKQKQKNCILL